jgi:2-polyprenyl-3-methyl-5-hydroxy-6-metoxy-1,4-benzoquinol methylase
MACRICFNPSLYSILNLDKQPLANAYHDNCGDPLVEYPLELMWCDKCTHLQLSYIVDKNLLYKHYQYVSGTSKTMDKYFDDLAQKISQDFEPGSTILDIACNDGSQLNHFKNRGWNTFGVDPAENIVSKITNHIVYNTFFNLDFAKTLNLKFDVIMAQNVVAHVDNVHDFIQGCKYLLKDNGKLYIQTSQCNMIQNNEFDTIYHEHHSFFNIRSMNMLVHACGLYLHSVERTSIHGTSFLFTIGKQRPTMVQIIQLSQELQDESDLYELETYIQYAKNVHTICRNFKERVAELRKDGYTVIGYGAAAKGNTLLNFCQLKLDYIIDDADIKWNLYTPGMNIPILPPSELKDVEKLVIIPLAWNFFDEIVSRVNSENSIFLKYFPKIEMVYPPSLLKKISKLILESLPISMITWFDSLWQFSF